jgi:hypothetical protein
MCVIVRIAVAAIALSFVLVTGARAKSNSWAGADNAGAQMEDCNCWEDFLEENLPTENPAEPPVNDDAVSSLFVTANLRTALLAAWRPFAQSKVLGARHHYSLQP